MGRGSRSATHFCVVSDGSSALRLRSDARVAEGYMISHPRPDGSDASDPPPARPVSGSESAGPPKNPEQTPTPLPITGTAPAVTATSTGFHAAAIPQRHPV